MGEHRIICGDSTDSRSLEILMSDDEARLILTDECPCSKLRIAEKT